MLWNVLLIEKKNLIPALLEKIRLISNIYYYILYAMLHLWESERTEINSPHPTWPMFLKVVIMRAFYSTRGQFHIRYLVFSLPTKKPLRCQPGIIVRQSKFWRCKSWCLISESALNIFSTRQSFRADRDKKLPSVEMFWEEIAF